jgi:hypothetical protein
MADNAVSCPAAGSRRGKASARALISRATAMPPQTVQAPRQADRQLMSVCLPNGDRHNDGSAPHL